MPIPSHPPPYRQLWRTLAHTFGAARGACQQAAPSARKPSPSVAPYRFRGRGLPFRTNRYWLQQIWTNILGFIRPR